MHIDRLSNFSRLEVHKAVLHEVADIVRVHRLKEGHLPHARAQKLSSVARVVTRNDTLSAKNIHDTTRICAKHITLNEGKVLLTNPADFENEIMHTSFRHLTKLKAFLDRLDPDVPNNGLTRRALRYQKQCLRRHHLYTIDIIDRSTIDHR